MKGEGREERMEKKGRGRDKKRDRESVTEERKLWGVHLPSQAGVECSGRSGLCAGSIATSPWS